MSIFKTHFSSMELPLFVASILIIVIIIIIII